MKRLMISLVLMATIAASASAMSLSKARKEALFLSDKMAYELSLSLSQYEAVYEINLDYLLGLRSPSDLDGSYWLRRNTDLRHVLSPWQWERYTNIVDFYRPMVHVSRHGFSLSLRGRYTNKDFYYYERPVIYGSYRGGHNSGQTSYYANRDFHRPPTDAGPQHYGSSSPQAYGSGRSGNKGRPSYTGGNSVRGGSSRGSSTQKSTVEPPSRRGDTRSESRTSSNSSRGSSRGSSSRSGNRQ